jgi:hypothetical protein
MPLPISQAPVIISIMTPVQSLFTALFPKSPWVTMPENIQNALFCNHGDWGGFSDSGVCH